MNARRLLMLAAALLTPMNALGQEPEPVALDAKPRAWRLSATAGVWYVGLGGDLTMPGGGGEDPPPPADEGHDSGATLDLAPMGLDAVRLAPALRVDARFDPWRLTFSGFSTSAESNWSVPSAIRFGTLSIEPGERVESRIDYTSLELAVGYRFWEKGVGTSPAGRVKVGPSATVFVGARLHDVGVRSTRTAAATPRTQRVDETFAEPIVGVRLEMDLYERATLDVQLDGGYSGPSASWSAWVGLQYRPLDWLGVYIGYRHLGFDLESGSGADRFRWDGAAAGLGAGAVVRF
jgi:hypothetical protein